MKNAMHQSHPQCSQLRVASSCVKEQQACRLAYARVKGLQCEAWRFDIYSSFGQEHGWCAACSLQRFT